MMKDWRGTPLVIGDTVVYPGRQGSSLWMNEGVVTALEPGDPDNWSPDVVKIRRKFDSGFRTWKNREDNRVQVEKEVSVMATNVTVVLDRGRIQTYEEFGDRFRTVEIDGRAS